MRQTLFPRPLFPNSPVHMKNTCDRLLFQSISVILFVVLLLPLLAGCAEEKEPPLEANGKLTLTSTEESATTENNIKLVIDKNNGKVSGNCEWYIDTGKGSLETIIGLEGTYVEKGNGEATLSGKATATYIYIVDGVEQNKAPKYSSWSATISKSGVINGEISGQAFSARIGTAAIGTTATAQPTGTKTASGTAQFTVTNLRVDQGTTSTSFSTFVDIENTSTASGTYHVVAKVDETIVYSQDETLQPGEKLTLPLPTVDARLQAIYLEDEYDGSPHSPHTVSIGSLSTQVVFSE